MDCAGKSTQRDRLMELLRSRGDTPVNFYGRPGYTPGLRLFKTTVGRLKGRRKPVRNGVSKDAGNFPRRASNLGNPLARKLWLMAALLDLVWLHCVHIRLVRARGRTVVCNRHLLDCLVDFRVNFPADRVEQGLLWRLLRRFSARPDATFCFLISAELTMERSRNKSRFHWEPQDVLELRRREYAALAGEFGSHVIDGTRSVEEIACSIDRLLAERPRRASSSAAGRGSPHPGSSGR